VVGRVRGSVFLAPGQLQTGYDERRSLCCN
jgi:hypothetical protein